MASDAGTGSPTGSDGTFTPPVFTRWSDDEPTAAPVEPAGAPPDDAGDAGAFPADAFILPEDAAPIPAGSPGSPASAAVRGDPIVADAAARRPAGDRAPRIADRLEAMARRLRSEGPAALGAWLESGDRLDTLLAGLLAGYLAADE